MVGFVKPGTPPVIGLVSDNVDPDLSDFVKQLAITYTTIPVEDTKCGYACR